MRILVVADTVHEHLIESGQEGFSSPVDLVVSCGDLPPEYLSQLRQRFEVPLFYVLGNHDIRYATAPPLGCEHVHGRLIRQGGLRILGLGGAHWYNGGPNQLRQKEMRRLVRRLFWPLLWHRGVDLVITHAPPYKVGDRPDPCHQGFVAFHSLIRRHQPGCLVHGHIHQLFRNDNDRVSLVGQTLVINCYGSYLLEI